MSIQGTIRLNDMTGSEPDIALLTPEASLDAENIQVYSRHYDNG